MYVYYSTYASTKARNRQHSLKQSRKYCSVLKQITLSVRNLRYFITKAVPVQFGPHALADMVQGWDYISTYKKVIQNSLLFSGTLFV